MVNMNISIRKEAYSFLKAMKENKKSFSDVILELKEQRDCKSSMMKLFGAMKDLNIDWDKKKKAMNELRQEFNRRTERNTIKLGDVAR